MRAFKALVRNAFRKNGNGGGQASLATAAALLLAFVALFSMGAGAVFESARDWFFMGIEDDVNVIVVNAPDTFKDFIEETDTGYYQIIYKEHPYVFDVATFSQMMDDEDATVTIVFDENNDILTFYPPDDLDNRYVRDDFSDNILDSYSDYLINLTGIPTSDYDAFEHIVDGVSNPNEKSVFGSFWRGLAYMLIPLLYFIAALYACMTKGTNLIAGAKEQNTFAAILMTPVPRAVIVLGNTIGVWLTSMIPAAVLSVPLIFIPAYRAGVLAVFIHMAVLSFFIASLVVMISIMSNNVISAQTAFLPIFLVFVALCITCMQNPEEYFGIYEYLPLYGQYLGIGSALTSSFSFLKLLSSSILTLGMAALCVYVSVRLLSSERFTVSVMSASDKELIRAKKAAMRESKKKKKITAHTSIFGFQPTSTINDLSFTISQITRPLVLLSVFQLIAMIPPLLMTDGEYLTNIMYSLKSVKTVSDVLSSGANIIGVLMSTPAFLLSMGFGYILIDVYYCLRVRFIERMPLSSGLGFSKGGTVKKYLVGILIGTGMMASIFGVLVISGQIKVTGFGIAASSLPLLFSYIFMWLFQGACEEIMFRGYMMPRIASRYGLIPAIAVSSLLFCLFHGINPGFSVLAFINLILISVLYGLIAYYTDNIWIVCAAHTFWNFTQGNVFGLEVSGNTGNVSFIHTTVSESANSLMTGGTFGPEGGLPVTIITVIGIVLVIVIFRNKKKTSENK